MKYSVIICLVIVFINQQLGAGCDKKVSGTVLSREYSSQIIHDANTGEDTRYYFLSLTLLTRSNGASVKLVKVFFSTDQRVLEGVETNVYYTFVYCQDHKLVRFYRPVAKALQKIEFKPGMRTFPVFLYKNRSVR